MKPDHAPPGVASTDGRKPDEAEDSLASTLLWWAHERRKHGLIGEPEWRAVMEEWNR